MTFDELIENARRIAHDARHGNAVTIERKHLAGSERLVLSRKVGTATRYLEICPVYLHYPDPVWDFTLLGGIYGSCADFDGRRGGTGEYILQCIDVWLVKLLEWDELPAPPITRSPKL